ncbi:Type I restriction-modification system specificity subunit S [Chromobacterium vaccinii]|nr:Type I restriction-modification system specificity subunit S [Chromobacterium vaccinii]QND87490.1 Type I restriction-modification system specificity subunit S [Chromobacterium vaccinii]
MVPKGWTKEPVKNFGDVSAGRQRSPHFINGIMRPYLRVANVFEAFIDTSDVNEMPFTEIEFQRYKLVYGDILLNEGQSTELVGRPAMYQGSPANCCFQNTLVRFKSNQRTCPDFALQRFLLCLHDGTFQRISKKTTSIAHLGVSRFADLDLTWPPLNEQKKIAKILSVWDQAIATAERLLDLARQQKKALMQQLLTGKKRFGKVHDQARCKHTRYGLIPEDWAYPAIREICKQVVIKNANQEEYPVLSCSKYDGFVDSLKYFNKKVYSDDTSGYRVIPRNCFGFPSNHIEEGSIGLQNLYDYGIVSPIYEVFRTDENMVNNQYLIALLKTEHYRQIFAAATNASVDRRGSLRWKEFASIHVPLPPLEEQNKIAAILNTTNQEIQTLQSQLDGLKQEKKALMQQLLTGKRRVQCALDQAEA